MKDEAIIIKQNLWPATINKNQPKGKGYSWDFTTKYKPVVLELAKFNPGTIFGVTESHIE